VSLIITLARSGFGARKEKEMCNIRDEYKESFDNGYNDGYVDGRHDRDYYLEKILYDVKQKGYDKVSKLDILNAIKSCLGEEK